MGWLTMEELWWDGEGHLRTHAPSTYKIPAASDWPERLRRAHFRARAQQGSHHPPLQGRGRAAADAGHLGPERHPDAVAAACDYQIAPDLNAPTTPEEVLLTLEDMRAQLSAGAGLREAAE